ncbi:MAG: CHAT domain-containing protein [Chloroflexota bacterium]
MDAQNFVAHLIAFADRDTRIVWMREYEASLQNHSLMHQVMNLLKENSDREYRANMTQCWHTVAIMFDIAHQTESPLHLAKSLFAQGNAYFFGEGDFQQALASFEHAESIYMDHGHVLDRAQIMITKVAVLANVGDSSRALAGGEWAIGIFERHHQWQKYVSMCVNIAIIHDRLGHIDEATRFLEEAERVCSTDDLRAYRIKINKSILLREQGQFAESIRNAREAYTFLSENNELATAWSARQSEAVTYFMTGRVNEALDILEQVKVFFTLEKRWRDAIRVDLYITDGLLMLHRYDDVVRRCKRICEQYQSLGVKTERALAFLNLAQAYMHTDDPDEDDEAKAQRGLYEHALEALANAEKLFQSDTNHYATEQVALERAKILAYEERWGNARTIAVMCCHYFQLHDHLWDEAQARRLLCQIALSSGDLDTAQSELKQLAKLAEQLDVPLLWYQYHQMDGELLLALAKDAEALRSFQQAIRYLDQLRGHLMIEHRIDFAAQHQKVYEHAISLCIKMGQLEDALSYISQSKSRALLDLLANRINLNVQAEHPDDEPLIKELQQYHTKLNRLYCRDADPSEIIDANPLMGEDKTVEIAACQAHIKTLWETLLIRNAAYAHDADLFAAREIEIKPIQTHIPQNTAILEYFIRDEEILLFVITAEAVDVHTLGNIRGEVDDYLTWFEQNYDGAAVNMSTSSTSFVDMSQSELILQTLYTYLFEPISVQAAPYNYLVVIPHGELLNKLPFHALHDGMHYLVEQYHISYLPNIALLDYCQSSSNPLRYVESVHHTTAVNHSPCITFGYSGSENRLTGVLEAATTIANLFHGNAYLEQDVTFERVQETTPDAHLIHFGTHGAFNEDNPLFSGLSLADGMLTTFDIFHLRLNASLVTLSACNTGRHAVGQSGELMGLMRAFLYAGASSLVLTHWAVEDRATAIFMQSFYRYLAAGMRKDAALRQVQLDFIHGECNSDGMPDDVDTSVYQHPYVWAPFFLVGDSNRL